MSSSINHRPPQVPPIICDFGWFFGATPARTGELSFIIDGNHYPPGVSTLTANTTLPTATISVASAASFESSGSVVIDNGITHTKVAYTGKTGSTLTGCTGGSGTFAGNTPIYDPRFYVDQMPLALAITGVSNEITFDALDGHNLGLPTTIIPPGIIVAEYEWDFGNGQVGYGPQASTSYTYNTPPRTIQTTLTVTDTLGRSFACAHPLNLEVLLNIWGIAMRIPQGSARV